MKKITYILLTCFFMLTIQSSFGQGWQKIKEGQVFEIEGVEISFITSYIKEIKGQDVYTITATISNNGPEITYLFPQARYSFVEETRNAWVQFRFSNATGKGLSSRAGNIFPNKIWMKFPVKCNSDKDEYHNRVIGVGLTSGGYISKNWRVRVKKGERPQVNVFMRSNF